MVKTFPVYYDLINAAAAALINRGIDRTDRFDREVGDLGLSLAGS